MSFEVGLCNIHRPVLKDGRLFEEFCVAVVCIDIPDIREGVRFALKHTLPLCFKLEAVVVAMIAENNVLVPSGLIANGEIVGIVFVARYNRISVSKAFIVQFRSFLPLIGVKRVLWLVDVNAVWCSA